ncbi:putative membrane protein [Mycetocola sp. BIGb0189]|uniref:TMEM175 family protein n=1 Tax=Mycetocola sp. BIGb0189 TaxID=2940604 RepID=UPI0021693E5B|nr:TMEM175 family protein [Mycetocola sp. BIGb0189]MCS4276732.1 putative membrane protein [Mycetocola sp. BIGb0189]
MSRILRTQRGLDRLVNFSDATVAIAITLLLLPLVDAASDARADRVGEFLSEHQGTLIAFFVSFAVIARMWTMHHRLFEVVHAYSSRLMRVNLVWLASIAFLPFASNMLAAAGQNPAARALYIGTIAVASLTFALMEGVVIRDPSLRSDTDRDLLTPTNSWLTFAAVLLALILTLIVPIGGVWWLLLLVPAGWVSDFLERRGKPHRGTGKQGERDRS